MVEQEILEMLTTMVEEKDVYTAGHSKRVAMYSAKIAEALSLSQLEQNTLYQAGLLHDIGKMLTPESILLKPRKFNRSEYIIIKRHSEDGERMLSFISAFKNYAPIVRHHHERVDGEGYPDGLKGEAIPLLSRIMSVADAFDAMTTNRIYKSRKNIEDAIIELQRCSGIQFDKTVVEASLNVFRGFKELVHASQVPMDNIHEERFAYFFKDVLTGAYSGDYLNYFLLHNKENHRFQCCYFIQLHHMQNYNERYGWKCGDDTLKEISLRIKSLFHSSFVFRVFGDDFVVLNPLHVEIDKKEILYKLGVGFDGLEISLQHFDFEAHMIDKWEHLENHLVHCDNKV
ncbi:MAG: HD domain-containing protein [Campylobacteraceae bacterium]|nr:HD domain-containing protein [Campylobacteraceae bacterium]